MSDAYQTHIGPFLENIFLLQKLEMSAAIHCSKINSLIRSYKLLPDIISPDPPPNWKNIKKFTSIINSLNNSIEHLIQLCIQCNRESCVQFVLMTSFQNTFEEFLSIRQKTISDFQNLNFPKAAEIFTLTPDELLSQDQVDLKLIGNLLLQIHMQKDVNNRKDIKERIIDRLDSLKRKDIKIDTNKTDFDLCSGIITIPSIPSNLNLVLDHEQLIYKEVIGEGRSGKVYKGRIVGRPDQVVAIKVLHCRELTPAELEMYRREIFTLTTLSHPSILKLLGYTNTPPFCLVTELLANGSIYNFLKTRPQELTPTDRTVIAIDIARGMEYIHERNIIHRDLKSLNILLDDNKRARICDFGLVRLKSYAPMTGLIGTPQWMAPEILTCSTSYNVKADVYSYGIVLWELLTGQSPYEGISAERLPYLIVQENLRPLIPKNTPTELKELIQSCWSADPSKRSSFSMIIKAFQNPKNHFPGTNKEELRQRFGIKKLAQIPVSSSSSVPSIQQQQGQQPIINASKGEDCKNELNILESSVSAPLFSKNSVNIKLSTSSNIGKEAYNEPNSISPQVETSLMSTPSMKYCLLNMRNHHFTGSDPPINHVDQIVLKYVEAVANNDSVNLDVYLNEIMSLYKSGILLTIPNSFIPETVHILRSSSKSSNQCHLQVNDEIKVKILKILGDFLGNRALFDQFAISDGFSMLTDLMCNSNSSVAELALITTSKHLRKEIITIDLIKSLLSFNSYNDSKVRNFALTTLFLVLDFQFEMLCTTPSFIYHLLCFALKPLPLQSIEQLLHVTLKFINKIQTFPVSVMSQLIWLQTNVPRQFQSIAVECLVSAVRLEEGRMCLPPEFWRYAQRDFFSYKCLYRSYVHGVTGIVHKGCNCCFCSAANERSISNLQEVNDHFKLKEKLSDISNDNQNQIQNQGMNKFEFEEDEKKEETETNFENDQNQLNSLNDNLNKANSNLPLMAKLPPRFNELVISLKELSAEHKEALQLLVLLTRDLRCASVVLTHLPISNKIGSKLLFKLYNNLSFAENAPLVLGEEAEFYTACKFVLGSKYQNDACQLIRRVGLNPFLLESSGLVEQITSLLNLMASKIFDQYSNLTSKSASNFSSNIKQSNFVHSAATINSNSQSKFKTISKSKYKLKSTSSKIKYNAKSLIDDDENNNNFPVKLSKSLAKTMKVKNENRLGSKKKMVFPSEDTSNQTIVSNSNCNDNGLDFESTFIEKDFTKCEQNINNNFSDDESDTEDFEFMSCSKEKEEEDLWNLMSAIFSISHIRCYQCFQCITQNLQNLMMNSSSSHLRIGAFLCLANFSLYTEDKTNLTGNSNNNSTNGCFINVDIISVLNVAAELVNNDNHATQVVCVDTARKNIEKVSKKDLKQIIATFLQKFENQSNKKGATEDGNDDNNGDENNNKDAIEFAEILFERAKILYSTSFHDENNINYNKTEKHSYASNGIASGNSKVGHISKAKLLQSLATVCSQK